MIDPGAGDQAPWDAQVGIRPRWQVLVARAVLILLVLGVLLMGASARLFVWPPTDAPAKVDAILALGGDPGQFRAKQGVALAEAGYAPVVMVSRGGYPPSPCPMARVPVRVICFRANPLNTRGEVQFAARLARWHHWETVLVVPERSQATRARMLIKRCSPIRIVIVPVQDPASRLLYDLAYEWAATAKALIIHRTC